MLETAAIISVIILLIMAVVALTVHLTLYIQHVTRTGEPPSLANAASITSFRRAFKASDDDEDDDQPPGEEKQGRRVGP